MLTVLNLKGFESKGLKTLPKTVICEIDSDGGDRILI